jgi:hypothetical protein
MFLDIKISMTLTSMHEYHGTHGVIVKFTAICPDGVRRRVYVCQQGDSEQYKCYCKGTNYEQIITGSAYRALCAGR